MREYTTVVVPNDLLPQVVGELLQFATNPDLVEVVDGTAGREIHAHPEVAEAWYQHRQKPPEEAPAPEVVLEAAPEPEKPKKPAVAPALAELAQQTVTRTAAKKNTTSA